MLPDVGYQLQLRRAVTDSALRRELDKLKEFISTLNLSTAEDHKVRKLQKEIIFYIKHKSIKFAHKVRLETFAKKTYIRKLSRHASSLVRL